MPNLLLLIFCICNQLEHESLLLLVSFVPFYCMTALGVYSCNFVANIPDTFSKLVALSAPNSKPRTTFSFTHSAGDSFLDIVSPNTTSFHCNSRNIFCAVSIDWSFRQQREGSVPTCLKTKMLGKKAWEHWKWSLPSKIQPVPLRIIFWISTCHSSSKEWGINSHDWIK